MTILSVIYLVGAAIWIVNIALLLKDGECEVETSFCAMLCSVAGFIYMALFNILT